MKYLLYSFFCIFVFNYSYAQSNISQTQTVDINSIISFTNANYDFGKIPFGKPAQYDLEMKNISKDSIRITNVQVGCGCTTPKWSAGPYAPGESFKVNIGFNGYTRGAFTKLVTLYFATKNTNNLLKQIVFRGETFDQTTSAPTSNQPLQNLQQAQ